MKAIPSCQCLAQPAALAGRWQPAAPLLIGTTALRKRGEQSGIVPQPGQELDAGRAVLGRHQGPDDALQGVAAVEDAQVPPGDDPGLLSQEFDDQFALGAEHFPGADGAGPGRQLRLAEVEPPGDGQEPGGSAGVVEQCPEDDPVVRPDGGGASSWMNLTSSTISSRSRAKNICL